MMLNINSELSRILSSEPVWSDGRWRARYTLDSGFAGFDGHFPGYPVLAAFIQVQMAIHLLRMGCGRKLDLARIGTAKFTSQAWPGDTLTVECTPVLSPTVDSAAAVAVSTELPELSVRSGATVPDRQINSPEQDSLAAHVITVSDIAPGEESGWDCVIFGSSGPEAGQEFRSDGGLNDAQGKGLDTERDSEQNMGTDNGQAARQVARFRIHLRVPMHH